jgi:hypothetical protein
MMRMAAGQVVSTENTYEKALWPVRRGYRSINHHERHRSPTTRQKGQTYTALTESPIRISIWRVCGKESQMRAAFKSGMPFTTN